MSQITLRGLPPELDRDLRGHAARNHTSINKTVVELLMQATGMGETGRGKKRDLSSVSGRWSDQEAEEFDRRMEPFEKPDEELWS